MCSWIASALSMVLIAGAATVAPPKAAAPARAASATLTKESLLERLSRLPGLEAKFREEKRMALLVAPLVSEGTLHFAPPGRLARHTLRPARSSVLIDGAKLSFGDARGKQAIDLEKNPTVRMFVESFVKILAGDGPALMRMYDLRFRAGTGSSWTLTLRPKLAPMNQVIERLTIRGDDIVLHEMEMVEVGGDVTLTTFTEVDTSRRYSDAELRRIFSLSR